MSIPAIPKDYYGHKTELFLDNLCNQESDNLRDHKQISNILLEQQYVNIQAESPETWKAFLRRIHKVIYYQDTDTIITYNSVKEYLERNSGFHTITKEEQGRLPFNLK